MESFFTVFLDLEFVRMGIIGIEALDKSGVGSSFYNRWVSSLLEPNLAAANRHAMQFCYRAEELRRYQDRSNEYDTAEENSISNAWA